MSTKIQRAVKRLENPKWVYGFGGERSEGRADMQDLLGGKGANLAEMASLGLRVPPGFTITTEACAIVCDNRGHLSDGLRDQLRVAMAALEQRSGTRFGGTGNPLLVSVRSGARVSMPGILDTVLNLGLNDETVQALAANAGDPRFAYDSYRRFIQMYANVVFGIDDHEFEEILDGFKHDRAINFDTDLSAEDWRPVICAYQSLVIAATGHPFPQDVNEQLDGAIGAAFGSWMSPRAVAYRRLHDIPDDWGAAVTVQRMVFGNMGQDCATGIAFTRNPSTGENALHGEYLINAQGEDVTAGIRMPQHLTIAGKLANQYSLPAMEEIMPAVFRELVAARDRLETHYRDMQQIEFTVQQGQLYMLQTLRGKRTTAAALRIAVEMAGEGLIAPDEAIMHVDPMALDQLLHPTLDPNAPRDILSRGLPASPGAASGKIVFNADKAHTMAQAGERVILCRTETSAEDIRGMHAAQGILTTRGGKLSHAAIAARGMGRPCVSGAGDIRIDYKTRTLSARGRQLKEGDFVTIDGTTGEVAVGLVPTKQPQLSGDFATLLTWADKIRRMKVRANAETPLDAQTGRNFGAEGIGLCRTEQMFFDTERILAVREMILADDEAGRRAALAKIEPMQRQDFIALFKIMTGLPVTIRLLDPPLHEFLPHDDDEIADLARSLGREVEGVLGRIRRLSESNPMLGHRGCRLGISYPEIYEMQARAIFEATLQVKADTGETVTPEIMIPLVGAKKELDILKIVIDRVAEEIGAREGRTIAYQVGTMIELPRAALRAGQIAETAEFFSFGTNDLTQTTFGLSRDDAGTFLPTYQRKGILKNDPFVTLDTVGVGELIQIAAERGRATRPNLKLGICGEHGGDPVSIRFCETVGLDYVSCSPYRVPIARLAAAQAVISPLDE